MIQKIMEIISESINNMWPMLTIFLVVITSVRLAAIRSGEEKFIFHKEFTNLLFIVYILLLYELLTRVEMNSMSGYNLVPFQEILRYKVGTDNFYINVVGNIALFVPFGYFISRYVKPKKILPILFVSLISSSTIEFVQLGIGRSFDVDDIILNVFGSFIGFLLYVSFKAIKKYLPSIFEKDIIYNLVCFLILVAMVLYLLTRMGVKFR